jgi:hypothetical protein
MVYLTIIVVFQAALIGYLINQSRKERAELEDRLMSTFQPIALTTHKALRDDSPGEITYVDEAREAELSPSWNSSP